MSRPLGLSVGTTTLVALPAGGAPVTCAAVPARPGRPEPDMAALADALDALAAAAGYGSPVVVAVPAYWTPMTIDGLRSALLAKPRLTVRGAPPTLVTDAAAAITALGTEPGLPKDEILALCDVDGAASITLINAGAGFAPISGTVRHTGPAAGIADSIVATLARDQVPVARLAAVALTGADPDLAAVGTRLSARLQIPVITPEQPACTAAAGALLMAGGRLPDLNVSTPSVIVAPHTALAWSEDDSRSGEPLPYSSADYNYTPAATGIARTGRFAAASGRTPAAAETPPWFRRRAALVSLAAAVAMAVIAGLLYSRGSTGDATPPPPRTTTSAPDSPTAGPGAGR